MKLGGIKTCLLFSYRVCIVDLAANLTANQLSENTQAAAFAHRVFVTSTVYKGNLGGIEGADAKCQTHADNVSLGGRWKAVISAQGISVRDRLHILGPVYRLDGTTPIASDFNSLWVGYSGNLDNTTFLDETGVRSLADSYWTGTTASGYYLSNTNCRSWHQDHSITGRSGHNNSTSHVWMNYQTPSCSSDRAILCINQLDIPPLNAFSVQAQATAGLIDLSIDFPVNTSQYQKVEIRRGSVADIRPNSNCSDGVLVDTITDFSQTYTHTDSVVANGRAYYYLACAYDSQDYIFDLKLDHAFAGPHWHTFVTSQTFDGNLGGQAGGDAKCQTAATDAGLTGTWTALISTTSGTAYDSIQNGIPVYNLANSLLGEGRYEFFYQESVISVNEYYSGGGIKEFWTGGGTGGSLGSDHCQDFSSNNSADSGTVAPKQGTWNNGNWFFQEGALSCDNFYRLACKRLTN